MFRWDSVITYPIKCMHHIPTTPIAMAHVMVSILYRVSTVRVASAFELTNCAHFLGRFLDDVEVR